MYFRGKKSVLVLLLGLLTEVSINAAEADTTIVTGKDINEVVVTGTRHATNLNHLP